MGTLDNIGQDATIGTLLPMLINLLCSRTQDTVTKKHIAWACCFVVTLLMGASRGLFDPFAHGVTFQTILPAVGGFLSSFGTILVVSSQMFDKFYQPIQKSISGTGAGGGSDAASSKEFPGDGHFLTPPANAGQIDPAAGKIDPARSDLGLRRSALETLTPPATMAPASPQPRPGDYPLQGTSDDRPPSTVEANGAARISEAELSGLEDSSNGEWRRL